MQFENGFSVEAPIERVWAYLLDVQAVAPCLPGAELTETVSDTEYKGSVKIKLGAMQVNYNGTLVLKEVDEGSHRVIMTATGSETRGTGGASGTVTSTLTADGSEKTTVQLLSEVNITGRVAQFGRNIIQDVSNKLIRDFARCLEANLTADSAHSDQREPVATSTAATTDRPSSGHDHVPTAASATNQPAAGDESASGADTQAATPAASAGAGTASPESGSAASHSPSEAEPTETNATAAPPPAARPLSTPPIGMSAHGGAELKVWPLLRDITRSRLAGGLRALAHMLDPDK